MRSPISTNFLAAAAAVVLAGQALAAASTPPPSSSSSSSDDDDTPLPVVIWHGLGDSFDGEGIQHVADLADAVHPGTFVYSISLAGSDSSGDRSATFFGNVTQQLDAVCALLAAHPLLSTAPAVDAIGFSQGGQFLRGYVERCNFPPVRNLITFGSQHNGIVEFKACGPSDWLCKGAMALLRFNTWSSFVQNRLVPAQYYRDPSSAPAYDTYLDASNFLADINNERPLKNETYKKNIASLENIVLYMFEDDTTVIPRRTAWFDEVNGTDITPLRERRMYKEDWLGLRALDRKGGIHFRSITGEHMQISDEVLNDTMAEFFGPVKSKAADMFESDEL
ncbi:Palmitoyl-protein hydrolase [Purpureocillium takamizusanense]|uniref:Palmitoyl-protein thioesterase 1 n=1 Tax=Purpureocillium takamizusanense TaxID=2060973 RepID=A0A9Q8QD95_9HYPO|nr:Palmitoyl-protein hydrolase [Purpureocillium takamizusanense]UNI16844.1 Palmitoyl-protein hydrolase [Purpureocillium takamizusanense]